MIMDDLSIKIECSIDKENCRTTIVNKKSPNYMYTIERIHDENTHGKFLKAG
jgi:hypothetical protein